MTTLRDDTAAPPDDGHDAFLAHAGVTGAELDAAVHDTVALLRRHCLSLPGVYGRAAP